MNHEHKHLAESLQKEDIIKRLNRIKGQVEGITQMLTKDKHCTDLIYQCRAVRGAISKVEQKLLEAHVKSCVVDAIKNNTDEETVIKELIDIYGLSS